ncbi:MAG: type 1 glutamine amidotransferase [Chitinophagaceae bacterium]
MEERLSLKIAVLDLYEGIANEGMRCIRTLLHEYGKQKNITLHFDEFDVRLKGEVPSLNYDIYISSGGPGSPLESEGSEWERNYFHWLRQIEKWNHDEANHLKKHVFFICHSFQLACRHYKLAEVTKRRSTAFGVFPMHRMKDACNEEVFHGLEDPFYAVDSRDYQVIQPHHNRLKEMGAEVLCIEKERPHVPLERAIMAIRFNDYMIGTQFHPEADAIGMRMYLLQEEKKKTVIENYGEEKWQSMVDHLNDPDKILWTYSHILPNFLNQAINHLQNHNSKIII